MLGLFMIEKTLLIPEPVWSLNGRFFMAVITWQLLNDLKSRLLILLIICSLKSWNAPYSSRLVLHRSCTINLRQSESPPSFNYWNERPPALHRQFTGRSPINSDISPFIARIVNESPLSFIWCPRLARLSTHYPRWVHARKFCLPPKIFQLRLCFVYFSRFHRVFHSHPRHRKSELSTKAEDQKLKF